MARIPPPTICASCGDPIPHDAPIYYAYIGSTQQIAACESCAAFHSGQVFTLGIIDEARRIIREHQTTLDCCDAEARL